MSFPWARRAKLDQAHTRIAKLTAELAEMTQERDDARQGALLAHEALARLQATQEAEATSGRERSELTRAIRDQSRGPDGRIDARLVGYFRGRANELLNQGAKSKDVIATLSEWQTTETAALGLTPERMADLADGDA